MTEKTELELLIENHLRLIRLRRTLELREGEQRELTHALICNQDLPELSVVRYGGKAYHLVADIEECDHITITEVADLGAVGGQQ